MNPRYIEPWGESCPWPREESNDKREGPKPRGPDWSERNPEAFAHEAARNRMRVLDNAVNQRGQI